MKMTCQQALRLLYDILDKEASEVDTKAVKEHLEKCSDCFHKYQIESSLHEFITTKVRDKDPQPSLERLKGQVASRLDEIDNSSGSGGSRRPFRIPVVVTVAAASLVLFIAAAFMTSQFIHHQEYIALEECHWQASERIAVFADANQSAAAQALLAESMHFNAFDDVNGFKLLCMGVDTVGGAEIVHCIYGKDDQLLSVFVCPSESIPVPDELKEHPTEHAGRILFDHNCRGCRLVYEELGETTVVMATTIRDIELLDFVPGRLTA